MSIVQILYKLQATDQEWDEKVRLYQALKQQLAGNAELEAQREEQQQRAKELSQVRGALRDAELELAGLQQRSREIENDLYGGRVRSPKELEGLRQDSEHLRKRLSALEDHVLMLMTKVDDLEMAKRQGEEKLNALEARWSKERPALIEQQKALYARLQELQNAREQLRGSLGRAELALYDQLRAKKAGIALAPVKNAVCQICRVAVPSLKVQIATAGDAVVTCEGCGRILYVG